MRSLNVNLLFGRLLREEAGQDLIEYALLVTFIGLVGILAWQAIGSDVAAKYGLGQGHPGLVELHARSGRRRLLIQIERQL